MKTSTEILFDLSKRKGIWFKSLVPFIADKRLTNPFRIVNVSTGENPFIEDSSVYEVVYFNGEM